MKSIASGVISGLAFVVFVFGFSIPVLWALLAAVLIYLSLVLVLSNGRNRALPAPEYAGLTRAQAFKAIRDGRRKVDRIRRMGRSLRDPALRRKVESVSTNAAKILGDFESDPAKIRVAKRFLDQYLDATVLVVQRYGDLRSVSGDSPDVQRVLGGFGEMLDTVDQAFERQHQRLLSDQALDFDTEITVLKKMLEMEGV